MACFLKIVVSLPHQIMTLKNISLFLFLFLSTTLVWGQDDAAKYYDSTMVQLYGVVVTSDSLMELPYTTIINKTTNRATISDNYGFFTMVVFPGDTLLFDNVGFHRSSYVVPDSLSADSYSIVHMMIQEDNYVLDEVIIYPWPSKEAFAKYFVEMNPYDDDLRRAQRQLSGENLAIAASKLGTDAGYSYGNQRMQQQTRLYEMNQLPSNNLLNPVAWSKFFKSLRDSKKNKK